ncbi:hypothetical protein AX15_005373 [Amanita polypyramis BW_CC]|nr:hypothetical protein AX15_005373 [Amanita polypyramis BW_CC]
MKIAHKSKKPTPPPPQVADLIANALQTSENDLADLLSTIDTWKWPRSDLNAWVKVLNKFDVILEEVIREYDVDKLQLNAFNPTTKRKICEILRFERLLLENSTNRKTFSSYDRLNSLLYTSDIDILVLALNLLLRPSQQYSTQLTLSHALSISTPRLLSLAKRWPCTRENGISLIDLVSLDGNAKVSSLPAEARKVYFSFYRTESSTSETDMKVEVDVFDTAHTPRKVHTSPTAAGHINMTLDEQVLHSKPMMHVLADAIEKYSVPESEKFELLCRTRAALALSGGMDDREKFVIVRLLSIAIFGHTHPEAQAANSLFLYEPDLIPHIAELLQVDRKVPVSVQTAAIVALDALARYRGKIQEVLTAVNAGVNHGILMALFRRMVSDIADSESTLPHAFIDALLSFVTFIASHASGGNMVVGAGLIPLLIQIIENKSSTRVSALSKTMQLVDNVLYSFATAFQVFCNSNGVDVLVERIEYEVDYDIGYYSSGVPNNELPISRSAVLKHILRSTHRMMQSSGSTEGLRGLIDTSLLKSIKKIIDRRELFGSSVLPLAVNIMATFVHNEPTSLVIIQEAGLPEAFYNAIEMGLEPAIEVIQAIPNAIGALCLNEAGQAQLVRRPSIIPSIFSIFTSERHSKVLLDKENAVLIGTAIDELIRHHPSLKTPVFEAINATLSRIEGLGQAFVVPSSQKHWYNLVPIQAPSDSDVPMEDIEEASRMTNDTIGEQNNEDEDTADRSHDNEIVSYIDIIGRFLEGLFQHTPHCRDFVTATDGFSRLGRLTGLPCLPYDYANGVASDSMVQIMRTTVEVVTNETFMLLAKLVSESLENTRSFWESMDGQSKLVSLVDTTVENYEEVNLQFRNLVTLHIRITLLSDVFATAGYAHGRASISLLQILMNNMTPQVVADLGALHRASVWENIALLVGLTSKGINVTQSLLSSLEVSPDQSAVNLDDLDTPAPLISPSGTNGVQPASTNTNTSVNVQNQEKPQREPRERNATALRHLSHGLPSSLAPFFQAMVKMFHARRNPDAPQKKQISESSAVVADIMLKHLKLEPTSDIAPLLTYYSVTLSLFAALLIDERTTTKSLHTVQLYSFYRAGGLDAVFDACRVFMRTIETTTKIREEDRSDTEKKQLVYAYAALKVALHLLHPVLSSKPLFDSAQTLITLTRDKKDTDLGYFEPHNFLVKLRLTALPFVQGLWEAPWLISAPLGIIKYVVCCVLELTNGENEESRGEFTAEASHGINRPAIDQELVRTLTEMGFPRSAAERALARTGNNVNAATELLLSQPFPLAPEPEPELGAQENTGDTEAVAAEDSDTGAGNVESTNAKDPPEMTGKNPQEYLKELNEAREPLRATIARQALVLIDEHTSLLFDLHNAFIKVQDDYQQQAIQDLVEDIRIFSPYAYDVQEQPLANRCRLLALILHETPSSVDEATRDSLMDCLLVLLLSSMDLEHPPRWLAAHLLVVEELLTLSEEPKSITLPKEGEPVLPQLIPVGPSRAEARTVVFDFCMRMTCIRDIPDDEFLSLLRLFVYFTRDRSLTVQFITRGGIPLLFNRLKASPVAGSSSYVAIILRHIVEDPIIVQTIVHQTIKRYLNQPRSKVVDVINYVRTWSAVALRDPHIFVEVTRSLCQLGQPYSASPHISLKPSANQEAKDNKIPPQPINTFDRADMDIDFPESEPAVTVTTGGESAEAVIHFLVSELVLTMKSVNEMSLGTTSEETKSDMASAEPIVTPSSPKPSGSANTNLDAEYEDKYQFMCFLMQCLSELLFSYDVCKNAFLTFSPKKRMHTPSKDTMSKHRMATLQFLLTELITSGTINPQPDQKAKSRISASQWAISVIVALCVDTTPHEEASAELVSVRRVVVEAISRVIKDLPSSENLDARYGRLFALSELCYRLLTIRLSSSTRKPQDDTPTHIAKVMLEKNLVPTLTTALSEVDLNYPNVRGLISVILRPLEYLTKIAIKMSRSLSKTKGSSEAAARDSVESFDTGEEDETSTEAREETPDLYRNSALGMYGGEMDDGQYSNEDEMDEDEGDEDEDVDMEFENSDSEGTSNTEDEEDEDELEEDEVHSSERGWDDGDEEDEDERIIEGEENDEMDDGIDEDDEEDAEEADIMWQNVRGEENAPGMRLDEGDEDEDNAIPIIHDDGERDAASDVEDYVLEEGVISVNDLLSFGPVGEGLVNVNESRDGISLYMTRRHRNAGDDNTQAFGRNRGAPTPPEYTMHPLLIDSSVPGSRTPANAMRGMRPPQRMFTSGDVIQNMEELMAGGNLQIVRHITNRNRAAGGTETFRFDMPAGVLVNFERNVLQPRRTPGVFTTSIRVERPPRPAGSKQSRELDPLFTLQRWQEEVKILNGNFVVERATKLVNHVILALLPAAVDAARKAKIKEEQERQEKARLEQARVEEESKEAAPPDQGEVSQEPDVQAGEPTGVQRTSGNPEDAGTLVADVDTVMLDATALPAMDEANDGEQHTTDQNDATTPQAPSSQTAPAERITVLIHGSAVDITDTGIDPTFLEALPDDMREEVLNQHVRDQQAARIERPPDSQISAEFLDALPPEIRAEILQQEAIERARRREADTRTVPSGAPAEIDAASFIASLDPHLRQAVLLEQDDGFIQTLPSHMIAEAGAYRETQPYRNQYVSQPPQRAQPPVPRKVLPQHDAVQLLDKSGIAVLVRLLFFPQIPKKTLLFKILLNLCENSKTRTESFNLLLTILQDGSVEHVADKSLTQGPSKVPKLQTPKSAAKQRSNNDHTSAVSPSSQADIVPDLIAQRCLECLTYIVSSNELSSLYFLTEHELPIGLRKAVTRKGKGKEKQMPQTYYPIVFLLLLLEKQYLLRTPAIMESIVSLLATVTRPLASLREEKKEPTNDAQASTTEPPSSAVPSTSVDDSQPAQASTTGEANMAGSTSSAAAESSKKAAEAAEDKALLSTPPQIPHTVLRLIVNILTVGECSGRTFQQSLALIQHLSYIPDARDVIAQELRYKAQESGQSLLNNLDDLVAALGVSDDTAVNSVAAKFSPASSLQAKLLRVLKTIDYMYSPKSSASPVTASAEDIEKVQEIYESFHFTPLWRRLGDCLSLIEEKPEMEHIATVLLPLIEALMVVCKYAGTKALPSTSSRAPRTLASPRSPSMKESVEDLFITFTDSHRKILNLMVRNNPSLMSGSFSLLVNNSRVLDFDNKRNYFNQQLHRRPHSREHYGTIPLNVRRARVFEDSFQHLQRKTGEHIKYGKLSVRFYQEEGVDAGGVTREWFQILARQMFDPNNALFQPCAADRQTYQPNKNSWVNPEHLAFFKFVGRVIGKAIYDGRLLDAYFARSLYRQLLGKPVDYRDVEWVDPEYYNSLCWILENDPTPLDLTFSVEADEFGVNRIVPLKPGGESIQVTQENRREYVQLSAQYRLFSSIKEQIESLSEGFYEIVPKELIIIFNEQELELLISGTPDIDVDEWRAATEYNGYTSSDPNIVWWWRALKSFTRDERAKVLSFATGTSRVPLNGFVDLQGVQGVQRFSIHRAYGEPDRLPQAHTCFNQIDLPQYTSYEMLRQQLLLAINEGGEGFAFS